VTGNIFYAPVPENSFSAGNYLRTQIVVNGGLSSELSGAPPTGGADDFYQNVAEVLELSAGDSVAIRILFNGSFNVSATGKAFGIAKIQQASLPPP
jgi:hypothetical protein